MSDELFFYTHPQSRGRIVRWMLEEVGQPYRTTILGYGTSMKDGAYRAINPMGKVPAIVYRGVAVTECAAICAYLADAFPDAALAPPLAERGLYYRWLFFAAGPVEAAVTNRALAVQVPPERAAMVGYGSMEAVLDALEQALAGREYIASDRFSAADLYVGAQLIFGLQFGSIEARPAFVAYVDRLKQRPACRRAALLDDEAAKAAAAAAA
jgi:glutathione S-transferase